MDWYSEACRFFDGPRPVRFTRCDCLECRDIDKVLSASDPDNISMDAFRDPATLRLSTQDGQKYYLPAFVRFIVVDVPGEPLSQFLGVLGGMHSSKRNLIESLNSTQLQFIERFLLHLLEIRPDVVETCGLADELLDCINYVGSQLKKLPFERTTPTRDLPGSTAGK